MKRTLYLLLVVALTHTLNATVGNGVELIGNSTFQENKVFKLSDKQLTEYSADTWYVTNNPEDDGMQVTVVPGEYLICSLTKTPKATFTNFVTQMIPANSKMQSGIYRLSLKLQLTGAKKKVPIYLKISKKDSLAVECSSRIKNGVNIDKVSGKFGSIRITPVNNADGDFDTWTTCEADLWLDLKGSEDFVRMFFAFSDYPADAPVSATAGFEYSIKDISFKRTADLPVLPPMNALYVRPKGDIISWSAQEIANPEQVISINDVGEINQYSNDFNEIKNYYFAQGTYTSNGAVIGNNLKVYGGFKGDEINIDVNSRVKKDIDNNGMIEPWEMEYQTIFTGDPNATVPYTSSTSRIVTLREDAVLDGVTIKRFFYSAGFGGAISVGNPHGYSSVVIPVTTIPSKGTLKNSIVEDVKNSGAGIVMLTFGSLVDGCLIQNDTITASNSGGAVFFNFSGGIARNCVIRNNTASGTGGAGAGIFGYTSPMVDSTQFIVQNCVIYNNKASYGNAIRSSNITVSGKTPNADNTLGFQISNSTISNGLSTQAGYNVAVESTGAKMLVYNSIINTGKGNYTSFRNPSNGKGIFTNCIVGKNNNIDLTGSVGLIVESDSTKFMFERQFIASKTTLNKSDANYNLFLTSNYRIANDQSVAITNKGVENATSLASKNPTANIILNTDLLGNIRQAGSYTIGAYQYIPATAIFENNIILPVVYPTIAADVIYVRDIEAFSDVRVYNTLGVLVKNVVCGNNDAIDISDMPKGTYIVVLGMKNQNSLTSKIIKK
jgi:hypothetical protein